MRPRSYSRTLLSVIFYYCSHEAVKPSKRTNHLYLRRDAVLIAGTAGESAADMVCLRCSHSLTTKTNRSSW